jgi:hypothetical protein
MPARGWRNARTWVGEGKGVPCSRPIAVLLRSSCAPSWPTRCCNGGAPPPPTSPWGSSNKPGRVAPPAPDPASRIQLTRPS